MKWILPGIFVCTIILISCNRNVRTLDSRSPDQVERDRKEASERDILVEFALGLRGVNYRYGGRSPSGFDCSGFTRYVYRKIDIELPPQSSLQAEEGEEIPIREAGKGDLVFFGRGRRISHVGMVVSKGKGGLEVIHSTSSNGVQVDDVLASDYWEKRLQFARSLLP